MLICPDCKFDNPNQNKFCQSCGTSLTEKACSACGSDVPVSAESCHHCGEFCGTVWLAIVTKDEISTTKTAKLVEDSLETPIEENSTFIQIPSTIKPLSAEVGNISDREFTPHSSPVLTVTNSSPEIKSVSYLDSQKRYKLLDSLPSDADMQPGEEFCVRVLDCNPYQITPLMAAFIGSNNSSTTKSSAKQTEVSGIPDFAKPYLALHSQCHQEIPLIHDAWTSGNLQVILLENRSNYQYLLELWHDDKTTSLQIVHYFLQMNKLWEILEPLNCRQSLLELSNLRLDEDQVLVLEKLYKEYPCSSIFDTLENGRSSQIEAKTQPVTIKSLGKVWHSLFSQSQRTQFGALMQLLEDLESGNIQTVEQIQLHLRAIASELQPNPPNKIDDDENSDVTVTLVSDPNTVAHTVLQFEESEENENKSDDMPTIVLPMQLNTLDHVGLTDVGRQRDHNEDYFGIDTKINKIELPKARAIAARGLYVLCDGMGGHAGGEVASELAVRTLQKYFQTYWNFNHLPNDDIIREGVRQANKAIYDLNQKDSRSGVGRMGTTLVMMLVQDTHVAVAHVGDSRLYRLTRKGIEQVTIDHEVGQREILRGVEPNIAYARPDAYQLTQALGPRDETLIDPDIQFFQVGEDTLFILASDGLSDNNLLETHWETHLQPLLSSNANLDKGVRELIDLANKYNGHDNITAVLVRAKVRPNIEQGTRE
ncbi:serine/threonine phosphatase [Brunnivagina elsteri]|uniref:Serine/threonine protein phosphatase n=1 Tax=Brunnivagina elsteri CCALA 953 TaxID=987040 RepID=A0A2A2TKN1_9CYAN|nr:serine/threonine phosphatase [Calothrix elsteri]PAX56968.1 serine/threonine protein phosphatase [Calothrix elsteri CCALA 953]